MTRARDIADVQDNLGGAVAPYVGAKNFLINGNYDIWQRGTSFANPASYFADRWTTAGPSAGVNNMTLSRETTGVLAGSQYLLRLTSTGTSSYSSVNQFMETANVVPLQGKTVTYSFRVRRNATYSNSGILVIINASSAIDAGTSGTYSTNLAYVNIPLASIPTTAATSTATYYTASVTFNVPNDGTSNSLYIQLAYNGAVASGSILEYSQMQLEIGSVATPFARAGGSIGGELALCQRYYWRNTGVSTGFNAFTSSGTARNSSEMDVVLANPVNMRTTPSAVDYGGTIYAETYYGSGAQRTINSLILDTPTNDKFSSLKMTINSANLTQNGRYMVYFANTTSNYIGISAEL